MTCERCGADMAPGTRGPTRKYCSDNCRKRACADRARRACPDCGGPMHMGSEWVSRAARCDACWKRLNAAARDARIEDVAEMYREGMSMREIASELGYGPNSFPHEVVEARRRGLIGYRYAAYERRAA